MSSGSGPKLADDLFGVIDQPPASEFSEIVKTEFTSIVEQKMDVLVNVAFFTAGMKAELPGHAQMNEHVFGGLDAGRVGGFTGTRSRRTLQRKDEIFAAARDAGNLVADDIARKGGSGRMGNRAVPCD